MAQDDQRAERASAGSGTPGRRGGSGRGFLAGLLGGVIGAGGSIYALQIPEVRESLPLPQAAELVVNPEAVARIGALEAELAQVRNAAREAEESSSIDALAARVDQLSSELTAAATTAQLASLRDSLSALASPEGAAALDERLSELEAALALLDEMAARKSSLATVEAAVEGFEARVGTLEEEAERVGDVAAVLERSAAELESGLAALTERVRADEEALIERTAALTGRIDAFARDVASFRESLGGADTRLEQMGERVDDLAATTERTAAQATQLAERVEATEQGMVRFEGDALSSRDAFTTAVRGELTALAATLEEQATALDAAVADAEATAANARDLAEQARAAVQTSLARMRAAAGVSAAAAAVGEALRTGAPLDAAVARLRGLPADALAETEADRLAGARTALAEHAAGVPTLGALQLSLDNLKPALLAAVTPEPAEDDGVGRRLFGAIGVAPLGRAPELEAAVEAIETALTAGDVEAALAAANTLPDAAAPVIRPWAENARRYAAVAEAREALSSLGRDLAAASAS